MAMKIKRKIADGIYQLVNGKFRVKVAYGDRSKGGRGREKQFEKDATLKEMKAWQVQVRAELQRDTMLPVKGTLAGDVPRYLTAIENQIKNPSNRKYELDAWLKDFGSVRRHEIRPNDVENQIRKWTSRGVAASTIRHRMSALSGLYKELDGSGAYNPVNGVERPAEPQPESRGVPAEMICKVLDQMQSDLDVSNKGRKTLARLKVLFQTGMRPSQLMRLEPQLDVLPYLDKEAPFIVIRDAGKGGAPHLKPLSSDGVKAVHEWLREDATGHFSTSSMYKSWMLACRKAGVPKFYPYCLRHSYATDLRRKGTDLGDIQEVMGHKSSKTTRRYAFPSDNEVMNLARALEGRGRAHCEPETVTLQIRKKKTG